MLKRTFLFLLYLLFPQNNIFACSCIASSPEELFKNADYVFLGRVEISLDKPTTSQMLLNGKMETVFGPGWIEARIKIEKVWKWTGDRREKIVVQTPDQGPACGISEWGSFLGQRKTNRLFLIYAYDPDPDFQKSLLPTLQGKHLGTNACTGTRLAQYARTEIDLYNSKQVR